VWAPFNLKNILLKNRSIENMKPRAQIKNHQNHPLKKIDGAQSSIERRPIPLKDINSPA
jgi:hypothetical protein